jgi:Kef-type K+ transport system membrane component KefB
MPKLLILYLAILLTGVGGIVLTIALGKHFNLDRAIPIPVGASSTTSTALRPQVERDAARSIRPENSSRNPLSILLLQVIVVLIAARLVGTLFRHLGQPSVIGEMVAGILLGPSLCGWLFPGGMVFLFPPSAMEPLRLLGQIGVILFMFTVGMELDLKHLRQKAHAVVLVSHTSIVVPFLLGGAVSLFIFRSFAPDRVGFTAFALFIGVAMSITAFPVLARIIEERGLTNSSLGRTALACAAVDDATAWCLLAAVVAIVKAQSISRAILTLVAVVLFVVVMFAFFRPQAARFSFQGLRYSGRRKTIVAGLVVFLFASALFTEFIGIHALFGAFVAGVILPTNHDLRVFVSERLELLTAPFLLPLFFAFTGLRTQLGLLNDWSSWLICGVVVAVAITGKLGGSMLAARWTGMSWHDSASLGVLMNTRGLIELIALNIGYDLGILSPRAFSMMVLMALITTFMAGPLLTLLRPRERREAVSLAEMA